MVIPGLFETDPSALGEPGTGTTPSHSRRPKYTPVACFECQRRKAKCSGDVDCNLCIARGVDCVYPLQSQRIRRRLGAAPGHSRGAVGRNREKGPSVGQSSSRPVRDYSGHRQSELESRVQELETALRAMASSGPRSLPSSTSLRDREAQLPPSVESMVDILSVESNRALAGNTSLPNMVSISRHLLQLGSVNDSSVLLHNQNSVFIQIPGLDSLKLAVERCARDLSVYQPLLEHTPVEPSILTCCPHESRGDTVDALIRPQHLIKASHIYLTLALWQCYECQLDTSPNEPSPDWLLYTQGLDLIGKARVVPEQCISLASCHLLRATYLTQGDKLQEALNAIWNAVVCARQANLHNETSWSDCTDAEVHSRKVLWWSIYCLERRLAQKCGISSIIDDDDIVVSDICSREDLHEHASKKQVPSPAKTSDLYLQSLVSLSRLWGKVWDTLFKLNRPPLDYEEEVALLDARILRLQQGLPFCLKWDDNNLESSGDDADNDLLLRKHTIHTRINLLRLFIRQNPRNAKEVDAETAHFCAGKTHVTVNNLARFVTSFPPQRMKAASYFVTTSLLECLYQAATVLGNNNACDDHATATSTVRLIHDTLSKMAATLSMPRRILKIFNLAPSAGVGPTQRPVDEQGTRDSGPYMNPSLSVDSLVANASTLINLSSFSKESMEALSFDCARNLGSDHGAAGGSSLISGALQDLQFDGWDIGGVSMDDLDVFSYTQNGDGAAS